MRLECRKLNKIFTHEQKETRVISDISFEAREGEFLCILGPSGCGKSTLLRMIAGLLTPSSGEVVYAGERNSGPLNSMVFQEYGVFPWMNVIDNVAFGLEMRGVPKDERYHQSIAYLKKVGLSKYAYRNPHELSVGMRQRIALARAFVNHPSILLMDEPFGSLDAQTRLILQDELLKIWKDQQKTVVFVTHDIDEAILLGDRVLIMTSVPGRIKEEIPVGIPRPRNLQMESSKEFIELRMKIWNSIRSEVEKAMSHDHDDF